LTIAALIADGKFLAPSILEYSTIKLMILKKIEKKLILLTFCTVRILFVSVFQVTIRVTNHPGPLIAQHKRAQAPTKTRQAHRCARPRKQAPAKKNQSNTK
jgi:hypothetical protein